jgi:hypothetical protein
MLASEKYFVQPSGFSQVARQLSLSGTLRERACVLAGQSKPFADDAQE